MDFKLALLKIFYALALEEQIIPGTPESGLIKDKQEKLLKLIKSKTSPPPPKEPSSVEIANSTSNLIIGLTKGLDLDRSAKDGDISKLVNKLTDNANDVLRDMKVNFQIPDKVKKKIVTTSTSLTKAMEDNPDPSNAMQIAVDTLKPKIQEEDLKKFEPIVEKDDPPKDP